MNLRVHYACLCSVGMFSWGSCQQETQCIAKPVALANTCTPTGWREKRSVQSVYVKGTEKKFLFGARKLLFLGMHRFSFLLDIPWEIEFSCLFISLFILFRFFFIYYVIAFFYFSYLISTSLNKVYLTLSP